MILQLNITTIIAIFCILNLTLIGNYYVIVSIYGHGNDADNIKNITELNNNSINKVKADDIDISYKKFGNGEPL